MKDVTRDRMNSWWWDWKPVVMILAGVLLLATLAVAAVFIIGVKPDRPTYTRDEKTGLCFAHSRTMVPKVPVGAFETQTVTNVPCTEAVLKEISTAKE